MIQVALVGFGYWGPNLARCIAASGQARLAAVCEHSPDRIDAALAAHPGVPVLVDAETALRDPEIGAVVLATRPSSHAALALRALDRGKHVLVEKPLAGSSAEALALAEAAARAGLVLMVDHTYLFSPAFETIQRLIAARGLGPLRSYHSVRANCFGPAHDTSVLWDLAVHDLALLDALMPSNPSVIQATGPRAADGRPGQRALLTLGYPDGASANVLVSWIAPAKVRTVLLGFDRHTIAWDDLAAGGRVQLFEPHAGVENIPVPPAEPLANAIRHFLDCIEQGASPRSNAASGVRTVQLLEAAERSLAMRGAPAPVELAGMAA